MRTSDACVAPTALAPRASSRKKPARRRAVTQLNEGLIQPVESNEEKRTEVVHYDSPPKRARFFSAINPTTSACRRFACIRRNHSSDKDAYPDYQVSMVRVPIRHDQSSLSFALARLHHDTRYLSSEMNHYQRPALLAGRSCSTPTNPTKF